MYMDEGVNSRERCWVNKDTFISRFTDPRDVASYDLILYQDGEKQLFDVRYRMSFAFVELQRYQEYVMVVERHYPRTSWTIAPKDFRTKVYTKICILTEMS